MGSHNFGWVPVRCHPAFGDNGITGIASLHATEQGRWLLGDAVIGQVVFDESPSLIIDDLPGANALTVDATYATGVRSNDPFGIKAIKQFGNKMDQLIGGAAVVSGTCMVPGHDMAPGRVVLIGPHFELTSGSAKHQVLTRAVAWAAGRKPAGCENDGPESPVVVNILGRNSSDVQGVYSGVSAMACCCPVCDGSGLLLSDPCPLCSD